MVGTGCGGGQGGGGADSRQGEGEGPGQEVADGGDRDPVGDRHQHVGPEQAEEGAHDGGGGQVPAAADRHQSEDGEGGRGRFPPLQPGRPATGGADRGRGQLPAAADREHVQGEGDAGGPPREAQETGAAGHGWGRGMRTTCGGSSPRSTTSSWQPSRSTSAARTAFPPATVATRGRGERLDRADRPAVEAVDVAGGRSEEHHRAGAPARPVADGDLVAGLAQRPPGAGALEDAVGVAEGVGAPVAVDVGDEDRRR